MIYSSWHIEHDRLKLVIYGHFLPFNFPKTQKIKILKNSKNYLWCHQFAHVYQKSQSYDIRFLRCGVRQTEFFVISGHLFLNEKNAWMYPFICVHQRWQSYDVWSRDMECNRCNFFSFWVISCIFIPLTIQKIRTLKKSKKCLEILSF